MVNPAGVLPLFRDEPIDACACDPPPALVRDGVDTLECLEPCLDPWEPFEACDPPHP